jgi:hypothetical protein
MFKKALSLLILVMYLHGMSGYTINFHKCMITGFENVYTGYGLEDPCQETEPNNQQTTSCIERGNCCDLQQTLISVDDERDITNLKIQFSSPPILSTLFSFPFVADNLTLSKNRSQEQFIKPPEPSSICTFRI